MSCASCVSHVERALAGVPGVAQVSVNLATESAALRLTQVDAGALVASVARAGYEVPTRTLAVQVGGMTCASCVGRVEAALRAVPGVLQARANLANERATVLAIEGAVSPGQLVRAIQACGYRGHALASGATCVEGSDRNASRAAWRDAALALAAAVPLALPMLLVPLGSTLQWPAWLQWVLASIVQFYCARRMYRSSALALRAGTGNMDLLVTLGSLCAYGLSVYLWLARGHGAHHLYFESSAVLIALVLLGRALEAGARRQTAAAVRLLAGLRPATARVLVRGEVREIALEEVRLGDTVVVHPGERIPVDGLIVAGEAWTDESMVTGESLPVRRLARDKVICGSTLTVGSDGTGAGDIRVQAAAVGDATVLASIIRLVEQAQAAKAPIQRRVDRVAAVFVPVVVAAAVLTLAGWLIAGFSIERGLLAAVSVLVIACPCALGLATPTAIIAGTGVAARRGILVRDVEAMELARRIQVVAFDKTGTLTMGRPRVAQVLTAGIDRAGALALAVAANGASTHPFALAARQAAQQDPARTGPGADGGSASVHAGQGVSCVLDGHEILFGRAGWLVELGADLAGLKDAAQALEAQGHSISWLARRTGGGAPVIVAALAFADEPREGAREAVHALGTMGIECHLISGDGPGATARIARELQIEHYQAQITPAQKVQFVEQLRRRGRVTAMVGDGINDAPALAAADVGIAMGSGTDVALHAAGIVLMRPSPPLVVEAIRISRATVARIRQNLFWAFVYNVVGIPLAAAGALTPVIAAGAMALSSLSVVANSLRLARWRP